MGVAYRMAFVVPASWLYYTLGTVHIQDGRITKDTLGTCVQNVHWTQCNGRDTMGTIKGEVYAMAISEARHRANEKWNAKAYDEIKVRVPKGDKEKIQSYAQSHGETVNGFINRLIAEAMGVDKTADEGQDL